MQKAPVIGITVNSVDSDKPSGRYESKMAYSAAVSRAGGVPVLLPHDVSLIPHFMQLCDGFILTGGADIDVRPFGEQLHPKAELLEQARQTFEIALLTALRQARSKPVLGICMGMQLMALCAGGRMNQHLPDTLGEEQAQAHHRDRRHDVNLLHADSVLHGDGPVTGDATVPSWHHQAVIDPGSLRLVAPPPDGVIGAVDDPARPFYLGVQWHPERGGEGPFNSALFDRLIAASTSRATP